MAEEFTFKVVININEMSSRILLVIDVNLGLCYVWIYIFTVISPDNDILQILRSTV